MFAKRVKAGEPWYKYPLVWLLIFIPAMTLVGSGFTLYYAITSTQSPVIDTYFKTGLKANDLAEKEKKAAELGLEAEIAFLADKIEVRVNKPIKDESLLLILQHPTLAKDDLQVELTRRGLVDGKTLFVSSPVNLSKADHWYLRVESTTDHWRVLSRKEKDDSQLMLTPYGQ